MCAFLLFILAALVAFIVIWGVLVLLEFYPWRTLAVLALLYYAVS